MCSTVSLPSARILYLQHRMFALVDRARVDKLRRGRPRWPVSTDPHRRCEGPPAIPGRQHGIPVDEHQQLAAFPAPDRSCAIRRGSAGRANAGSASPAWRRCTRTKPVRVRTSERSAANPVSPGRRPSATAARRFSPHCRFFSSRRPVQSTRPCAEPYMRTMYQTKEPATAM